MNSSGVGVAFVLVFVLIYLGLAIFEIVALWRLFTKAGQAGWKAIIPFYNAYIILKISGKPGWWLILLFIPIVNLVMWAFVVGSLARSFGRDGAFAVGLFFLSGIFIPILAFGESRYLGPDGVGAYGQGYPGYPPQGGYPGYPPQGYPGYPPQGGPGYPPQGGPGYPPQGGWPQQ